jgi:hypothetical protein
LLLIRVKGSQLNNANTCMHFAIEVPTKYIFTLLNPVSYLGRPCQTLTSSFLSRVPVHRIRCCVLLTLSNLVSYLGCPCTELGAVYCSHSPTLCIIAHCSSTALRLRHLVALFCHLRE